MTVLTLLPTNKVEECWQEARPWIDQACRRGGFLFGSDYVKERCLLGTYQMWGAVGHGLEAIAVTEITEYPKGRVFTVFILTGRERARWLNHKDTMEKWAKAQGCVRMDTLARPGWKRVLEAMDPRFKMTHVLLEKDLRDV